MYREFYFENSARNLASASFRSADRPDPGWWSNFSERVGWLQGQDGRRRWRPVAERAMRPHLIKVLAPGLDQILGLGQRVEQFAVEQFIAQLAVKRFVVTIFPGDCRVRYTRF